jgi:hypothetical protein
MTTTKNALAHAVRQLPAIARLGELWQQRTEDGESDDSYWGFIEWVERGSSRGAPPDRYREDAIRFEWAERAMAYERASAMQRGLDSGSDPHVEITDNLLKMVQLETEKLLKLAMKSSESVVSVKELLSAVNALREIQLNVIKDRSAKVDLSALSTDELNKVLQAQDLLNKTRKT